MRYLLLFVCPPFGFVLAKRSIEAVVCVLFESFALALWSTGLGPLIHGICIIWSINALGAAEETIRVNAFIERARRIGIRTR